MKAKCMHCETIHPFYEFQPGQLCFVLWCETCRETQMHEPVEGGLTMRETDGATLFGMRVVIANWLNPGEWFMRPQRRR